MKHPLKCFTIPAGKPFVNQLAAWILEQNGRNAAALAKALVLLPNRRACRALREAFLDISGGKPLLLPRIRPLGDLDEEEAAIHLTADMALPPPMPPLRRTLLLTQLVQKFSHYSMELAAELARQLARFTDDVAREGLSFERLSALAPEELAAHWQQTLDFLALVSQHWPRILESEGALDSVEHRNRLLKAAAKAWRASLPDYPIIAAGSTGSQPATAELLAVIARLPQGAVILPGLDTGMPDAQWEMVAETHPQYGMKQLLERMGCGRGDVTVMPHPLRHLPQGMETPQQVRGDILRAILAPPEATAQWKQEDLPLAEGLKGICLLTADTLLDEARMIAIALRETLETPGKTAALVTPERQLARMVAAQMQRFGVVIDDSAGQPLKDTPPACFLRLVADMAASGAAPAPLLAALRHPLAAAGREYAECRRLSRLLEMELLRGVRRVPGMDALAAAAKDGALKNWLSELARRLQEFSACFSKRDISLAAMLKAHLRFAEWLASSDGADGAARLWAGDAGNQLAEFLAELVQQAELLSQLDPVAYPGLFETLLAGEIYRPRYGLHPRLHILSPMEARLLQFDRVILGGLNEGVWPAAPAADPWMSRPMRTAFGLPPTERSIGQSAHDFYLLAAAPEVILSRSRKVEGTPTIPSRWLVRLETLAGGLDAALLEAMRCDAHYGQAQKMLDAAAAIPAIMRPAPVPPLTARPRKLRVTAIDRWLRDPYMIYAQYILKLKPLEALDKEPDAAEFGTLVHKALEQFMRRWPQALPDNAYDRLLECGRAAFGDFLDRPSVACLWWPRFEAMAAWLAEIEKERRLRLSCVLGESQGEWRFDVDGRPFTLTTRIDRMEIGADGRVTLVDYKTGYIPKAIDLERGLANQLPLEALVVMHGKITPSVVSQVKPVHSSPCRGEVRRGAQCGTASQTHAPSLTLPLMGRELRTALEYWKLAGNQDGCDIIPVSTEEIEPSRQRLEALIRRFDHEAEPYAATADPTMIARFNDYEHLTRRDEWEAV